MTPKGFCKIIDQIQHSIFKKLDKYGTYRRVDEGIARDAVSKTMDAAKSYFGNQKINSDHTSRESAEEVEDHDKTS